MSNNERLMLVYKESTAIITMDDGKANAMDNDWFRQMLTLLDEVEDSDVRALIIKGRDGVFSGGLNVKWLPTMSEQEAVEFSQLFPATMNRIYAFSKPVVAQVTGHAIAGGCLIACACDRRVALSGAKVAMNEVRVNMTVSDWIVDMVMDAIPAPQSKTMLKFGEPVLTDDLVMWHVFDAVGDDQNALEALTETIVQSFEGMSLKDFAGTKTRVRDRTRS